jgi:hypothetical protein
MAGSRRFLQMTVANPLPSDVRGQGACRGGVASLDGLGRRAG